MHGLSQLNLDLLCEGNLRKMVMHFRDTRLSNLKSNTIYTSNLLWLCIFIIYSLYSNQIFYYFISKKTYLSHTGHFKTSWKVLKQLQAWCNLLLIVHIKACVCYFLSNFYFSPNDSPSKHMKNVFYFIKWFLFVLEMFKFLYFCLPFFSLCQSLL